MNARRTPALALWVAFFAGGCHRPGRPHDARIADLAAGLRHTCARAASGLVQCWGQDAGALDGGQYRYRRRPTLVSSVDGVVQLVAGEAFTCARTMEGAVQCWGDNTFGQLGDKPRVVFFRPTAIAGAEGATQLALGRYHGCVALADGSARCWGQNASGRLGDGTERTDRGAATPVEGLDGPVAELALGAAHSCARLRDGTARCWGAGDRGQLGDGANTPMALRPVRVAGLSDAAQVVSGAFHVCARTRAGEALCWGANDHGQLGDGSREHRAAPTVVRGPAGASPFVRLAAGAFHTCGVRADGSTWCWGANDRGQLGDGTAEDRAEPVAVAGLTSRAVQLALGADHTCAALRDGSAACWGNDTSGELGNGRTSQGPVPRPARVLW